MTGLQRIWGPDDAADAARAASQHRAERGVPWVDQSRPRKAKRHNRIFAALALVLAAALAAAGIAKADSTDMRPWAWGEGGAALCDWLDHAPDANGIDVARGQLAADGLSGEQVDSAIWWSVRDTCPRHVALLASYYTTGSGVIA